MGFSSDGALVPSPVVSVCGAGTVVRDDVGLSLEKVGKEVLGSASKVVVSKDSTLLVTDGSTQDSVEKRIKQIASLVEVRDASFFVHDLHYSR